MEDPFTILAPFLRRMDGEVGGRSSEGPDEASTALLKKLASGGCPQSEVEKALQLLEQNPGWVPYLADYVRDRRG